ncbi:MAG: hypothetical protein K0Q79_2854 [Flavipsychrobacter sp.]|jgi:uncharacterized RDD family membrane protein YckC|nr:hypothetical protein [Flavipsychrobacter sp.]
MEEQLEHSIFPERRLVYATFWARFWALVLDILIVEIPLGIVSAIIFPGDTFSFRIAGVDMGNPIENIGDIVVVWLYTALLTSGPAMATIGKRALGIKVTDLNGERITFGQASARYFCSIISFIILLVGYFMMLWDEKGQTLHDKMAGTLVVASE